MMAGWRATVEAPLVGRYRDVEVAKTGSWGQGPTLLQAATNNKTGRSRFMRDLKEKEGRRASW